MNREIRGLHEAAYLLALFTFLSQILALLRDRTFAHFFGAGPTLDAYFAAFRVPDLLFAFLTLFVSAFAIIPLLASRGGPETKESRSLIGSILISFGVFSAVFAALLFLAMPQIVPLFFPGFDAATHGSVVMLSRIMLIQPILLGFSSVIGALVQAARKFFIFALAPIFYNLGIIAGVLFLYPYLGIAGLGWGVAFGAFLHFCIQMLPLFFHQGVFRPVFGGAVIADTLAVVRRSLPRAFALSANQILMLALVSVASLAAAGSVASVSFAFNLQSVPLSVIGVSYAAALFPSLALRFAKQEHELFITEVWAAIRHIVFWTAPAIALMIVLRAHIVRVILGSGAFSWDDTRLTAAVLAAFAISLIAQAAMLVFSRAYYAAEKEVVPIVLNVGVAVVAGLVSFSAFTWFRGAETARYFVEHLFRIDGIPGSGVVVVALSYSVIMLLGSCLFGYLFARQFGFERRVLPTVFHATSSAVIAAAAAYAALQVFGPLLPTETFVGIFIQGIAAGLSGFAAWALTLTVLHNQEFREVVTVFWRLVRTNHEA